MSQLVPPPRIGEGTNWDIFLLSLLVKKGKCLMYLSLEGEAIKKITQIVKRSLNRVGGQHIFIIKITPEIQNSLVLVGATCKKIPTKSHCKQCLFVGKNVGDFTPNLPYLVCQFLCQILLLFTLVGRRVRKFTNIQFLNV